MIIYEIPGNPIAWKRARRFGDRYFDAQIKEKQLLQDIVTIYHRAIYCGSAPLILYLEFHMPIPQSWSRGRRLNAINTPHTNVPDGDNLEKFLLDGLNEILWKDDKYIFEVHKRKTYQLDAKTRLCVKVYEGEPLSPLIPN